MKCKVCGENINPGEEFCKNCETKAGEAVCENQPRTIYPSGEQPVFMANVSSGSKKKKFLLPLVIVLAFLLAGAVMVFLQYGEKTVKIEDFKVKMPVMMKEDKDGSVISFGDEGNSKVHGAYYMDDFCFVYEKWDGKDFNISDITEEGFAASQYNQLSDDDKILLKGNTMYYKHKQQSTTYFYAETYYIRNGNLYCINFGASSSKYKVFRKRIDKWIKSVEF